MPNILPPSAVSDPTEMSFLLRQLGNGDIVTFFYRLNSTSPVKSMTVKVDEPVKTGSTLYVLLQRKGPPRPGQTGGPALEDRGHGQGLAYAASMGAKRIPVLALSKGKSAMVEDKEPTMKQAMANAQIALAAASKLMAGEGELDATLPAAIDFMDRLATAATKAKRSLESKGERGIGDLSAVMSLLYSYRDEDWFNHFFK